MFRRGYGLLLLALLCACGKESPDRHVLSLDQEVDAQLRNTYRWRGRLRDSAHIAAADVVLGGDSLRLGVVERTEFPFLDSIPIVHADHLILLPWGTGRSTIDPGQTNLGIIDGRTVFRVGRRSYYVESLDSTRRAMVVRPVDDPGTRAPAAELDLQLRAVPVRSLSGETVRLTATPGKQLVIYFWSLGSQRPPGSDVRVLDSLYQALPAEKRAGLELVLVNRVDAEASVRAFLEEVSLKAPVYLTAPNTCRRLNCHPDLPYWIDVDATGRIRSFDRGVEELAGVLW